MGLLGLPLELFRDILALTVVSFSLEDDTQPRFVNSAFTIATDRIASVLLTEGNYSSPTRWLHPPQRCNAVATCQQCVYTIAPGRIAPVSLTEGK